MSMSFVKTLFVVSFLLIFSPFTTNAQEQFFLTDSFQLHPESSVWLLDTEHFIQAENGWQLNANSAGESTILTPIPTNVDFLSTSLTLDFSPSNANNAQIILASDNQDLASEWNGYLLQLGENGTNDMPELIAIRNGKKAFLVKRFEVHISAGNEITFTLERDPSYNGYWQASFSLNGETEVQSFPFIWEASNNITYQFSGFRLNYTQSNTKAFRLKTFTLGYQKPTLIAYSSSFEGIILSFSHAYDFTKTSQFLLNNLAIDATPRSQTNTVLLPWHSSLTVGNFPLRIKEVSLFGSGLLTDTLVTVAKPHFPKSEDLLITEFLAVSGESNPEFVEIFNTTDFPISLNNIALYDKRDTLFFHSHPTEGITLPPKAFAVIGENLQHFYEIPETAVYLNATLPTLNNGGDKLAIIFNQNQVIDELNYESSWVKSAESTERKRLDLATDWRPNWEFSGETQSFTPGYENSITLDNYPPSLIDYDFRKPDTLVVYFDEAIENNPNWEIELQHDNLNNSITYTVLATTTEKALWFKLHGELPINTTFELKIHGISDVFGNTSSHIQIPLFLKITPMPNYGDIVINEFLADGPVSAGEFIELLNTSEKLFDTSKLSLTDASGQRFRFNFFQNEQEQLLFPNDFIAVGKFSSPLFTKNFYPQNSFLSLNNSFETLQLWYNDSLLVDEVAWGNLPDYESQNTNDFVSMEKTDPNSSGKDPSKWKRNASAVGHSIGELNSQFMIDQRAPTLLDVLASEDSLTLVFSEFSYPNEDFVYWLDGVKYEQEISDANQTKNASYWQFPLSKSIQQRVKEIEIANWVDYKGNILANQRLSVSHKAQVGELVLNEIFYQPIQDDEDGIPNQFEWLEFYNNSEYQLLINDHFIHQGVNESGFKNVLEIKANQNLSIAPSSYFLLSASDQNEPLLDLESSTLHLPKRSLSLSNDSGMLFIANAENATLDSVHYNSSWHHPALQIQDGISLERINANYSGFSKQNWGSSASKAGHSAGIKNSLSPQTQSVNNISPENAGSLIEITPQIFSPNGDGIDEVCEIKLRSTSQSEILNAKIFDRTGLLIANLTVNHRAAASNYLVWNGRSNNNKPLPTGVYILWVEWKDYGTKKAFSLKKRLIIAPYH